MSDRLTDSQITEGLRLAGEGKTNPSARWAFVVSANLHYAAALAEVQALRGQVRALQAHNSGSDNTAKRYVGPADTEASR